MKAVRIVTRHGEIGLTHLAPHPHLPARVCPWLEQGPQRGDQRAGRCVARRVQAAARDMKLCAALLLIMSGTVNVYCGTLIDARAQYAQYAVDTCGKVVALKNETIALLKARQ